MRSRKGAAGPLNDNGFTLLEVIIAMAIMVLAFTAILAVQSGSLQATIKSRQLNVVAMLARNRMVDAEFQIQGKAFNEVQEVLEGVFEAPYQDYRWKQEIKEIEFPAMNLGKANATDAGSEGGGVDALSEKLYKLFGQYLSQAIRLVNVTIIYKRGKGEGTFTASTYWVDLNSEFKFNE